MVIKPINLKAKAVELLAIRDYSAQELKRKLQRYSEDEEAINALLAELAAANYLNEQRFIENYIHSKSQKYGALKVKYLLAQKVSDRQLIEDIYQHAEIDELSLACQQLRRKFAEPPVDDKAKGKYLRFLLNRGFNYSLALSALKKAYLSHEDD